MVLLLFSIGLEFSLARLRDILRQVALGGAAAGRAHHGRDRRRRGRAGRAARRAACSTASCSRSRAPPSCCAALAERRELDAPHGRFIVGTLIFQDLCVVPMVLIVPLLGARGSAGDAALRHRRRAGQGGAGGGRHGRRSRASSCRRCSAGSTPAAAARCSCWRSSALCIGTAWLTSLAGLSLALGAFLGGMVVADTEYGHRAMGDILPLRDAFVSIFFVSLGMLFDVRGRARAAAARWPRCCVGFLLAKGLLATLAAMAMRFPSRVAWLAGVGLAQFGEFGFVLVAARQSQRRGGPSGDRAAARRRPASRSRCACRSRRNRPRTVCTSGSCRTGSRPRPARRV